MFGQARPWLTTMTAFPAAACSTPAGAAAGHADLHHRPYTYVELLDFSGPVQRALRAVSAGTRSGTYWFPEVRTLLGAILVLSAVL